MTRTAQSLDEAEALAELTFETQQTADLGVGRGRDHLVDVLLRDAELFGVEHGEQHPARDAFPLLVALAHDGAERLFGNQLGQDLVLVRVLQAQRALR